MVKWKSNHAWFVILPQACSYESPRWFLTKITFTPKGHWPRLCGTSNLVIVETNQSEKQHCTMPFNHCDHWKVPTESDFSQWLCHPEHKNFGFFSNGVLPLETSNGYGAKEMSASDLGWWSIKKWTLSIRGFPTLGVPKNGWSMIGNPFKVDDLGVPPYWFSFEPSP